MATRQAIEEALQRGAATFESALQAGGTPTDEDIATRHSIFNGLDELEYLLYSQAGEDFVALEKLVLEHVQNVVTSTRELLEMSSDMATDSVRALEARCREWEAALNPSTDYVNSPKFQEMSEKAARDFRNGDVEEGGFGL